MVDFHTLLWWLLHWWVFYRSLSTFLKHVKTHPLEAGYRHPHTICSYKMDKNANGPLSKESLVFDDTSTIATFLDSWKQRQQRRFLGFNYLFELIDTFFQLKTCHVTTVFLVRTWGHLPFLYIIFPIILAPLWPLYLPTTFTSWQNGLQPAILEIAVLRHTIQSC